MLNIGKGLCSMYGRVAYCIFRGVFGFNYIHDKSKG